MKLKANKMALHAHRRPRAHRLTDLGDEKCAARRRQDGRHCATRPRHVHLGVARRLVVAGKGHQTR